ncbi:hypothetical protein [Bacillus sp. JCM 19041]|uniref:hypothetical protein n=1 Tax=Bacillus sp. JCM 19041 TaxID=1460637 RepID=UPI0006D1B4B7
MGNEGENPQQSNGEETPEEENGNNEEPTESLGLAAEDEFTREFLVSTEEEEEGFYRMRGELGGFEMLMPKDAELGEMFHQTEEDAVERMTYFQNDGENGTNVTTHFYYHNEFSGASRESYLKAFANEMDFGNEFELTELDNKQSYTGETERSINGKRVLVYIAYIFSSENKEAISIEYNVVCRGNDDACDIDDIKERETFNKIINSIEFSFYKQEDSNE